jgi:sec-independent protein translocase protein TatA
MQYFGDLSLGAPELLIVLALVVLLFGGKKLPEIARSLGQSLNGVKKEADSVKNLGREFKSQVTGARADIAGSTRITSSRSNDQQPS